MAALLGPLSLLFFLSQLPPAYLHLSDNELPGIFRPNRLNQTRDCGLFFFHLLLVLLNFEEKTLKVFKPYFLWLLKKAFLSDSKHFSSLKSVIVLSKCWSWQAHGS